MPTLPEPAFPNPPFLGVNHRDYFAAVALSGLCSLEHRSDEDRFEKAARTAYRYADAMLAQRLLPT